MTLSLDHLAVPCRDQAVSARHLTDMLGLPAPKPFGPFLVVELGNEVSMDCYDIDHLEPGGDVPFEHYAFLVPEDQFDQIFGRIKDSGQEYWAGVACAGGPQGRVVEGCTNVVRSGPDVLS